jgi:4'-phosphopantetheinyl transferase EntD
LAGLAAAKVRQPAASCHVRTLPYYYLLPAVPLHRLTHLPDQQSILGLWHLTEPAEDLLRQLPVAGAYAGLMPTGRDVERPRQWLAGRNLVHELLRHFTDEPAFLRNDADTNQPYLAGKPELSVSLSHSGVWVAALLSAAGRVGIDVEIARLKARLLATKFLTETELADAGDDDLKYSLNWSAKETLYKLHSRRRLIFKQNLLLDPYTRQQSGVLTGHLLIDHHRSQYDIHYEHLTADCVLTWCVAPTLSA